MGCCGLSRRHKRHGKLSKPFILGRHARPDSLPPEEAPSAQPTSPPLRRASLTSVQSGGSTYYDANEELEHGSSPPHSHSDSSGSPAANGTNGGQHDDSKGPLALVKDIFVRRSSLKGKASAESGGRVENGVVDEDSPRGSSSGCLPSTTGKEKVVNQVVPTLRPFAGASFNKGAQVGRTDGVEHWQVADATSFMVRGKDYLQTKKKVPSRGSIYRLIGVDAYSFEQKLFHIAQHVQLPQPPKLGPDFSALPRDQQLPPLLIINIQLPLYQIPLIGGKMDGKGVSLVYYFALPEGFEVSHVGNDAALDLVRGFVNGSKESDGTKSRERLKLIARVVNVDEWSKEGPLNSYERGLLVKYNDKPILTRPQQSFFTGKTYLEVDIDIHSYAWLARRAFSGFIPRLGPVVFENAFVLQGNKAEELPEVVLACARVSRLDLYKVQPFPASLRKTKSDRTTVEMDPNAPPLTPHIFPDDRIAEEPEVEAEVSSGAAVA